MYVCSSIFYFFYFFCDVWFIVITFSFDFFLHVVILLLLREVLCIRCQIKLMWNGILVWNIEFQIIEIV